MNALTIDVLTQQNLIREFGLGALSESELDEAIETLGRIVFEGVMLRAIDIWTERDKDRFDRLMDSNPSQEAVTNFLRATIPDFDEIVRAEVASVKAATTGVMKNIGAPAPSSPSTATARQAHSNGGRAEFVRPSNVTPPRAQTFATPRTSTQGIKRQTEKILSWLGGATLFIGAGYLLVHFQPIRSLVAWVFGFHQ
jgi:hypothetical protein